MPLVDIQELEIAIQSPGEPGLVAVRGVSLVIERGQTLAIVGESGCGKTLTCLALIGLLKTPVAVERGRILFDGIDLEADPLAAWDIRRKRMGMIFQDPLSSLNPVKRVGWQVAEAFHLREGLSMRRAQVRAIELLDRVGIPEARRRARAYPHELSGGMNQRVMIAMAIAGSPDLLICDEATTALDVTIQAQILELLHKLAAEFGMTIVFVTHDLATVAEIAQEVAVMYAGQIIEQAGVEQLFASPLHPYTQGLLGSIPSILDKRHRLASIEGMVPALNAMPSGCAFAPRCDRALAQCGLELPKLHQGVACHLATPT